MDSWEKGNEFEKGMGVVLRNAWAHVEAVQTTDLPCLIQHIAFVLHNAMTNDDFMQSIMGTDGGSSSNDTSDSDDLHQRQEILVFYYIFHLLQTLGDVDEDRYASHICQHLYHRTLPINNI